MNAEANRYCTSCGTELLQGATFCTGCGKTVSTPSRGVQSLPAGPVRVNDKYIRWALWAAAILVMCTLGLAAIALLGSSLGLALIVGAVMAMLPVPIYLALALWIDRYEKEPIGMLALTFLWGRPWPSSSQESSTPSAGPSSARYSARRRAGSSAPSSPPR